MTTGGKQPRAHPIGGCGRPAPGASCADRPVVLEDDMPADLFKESSDANFLGHVDWDRPASTNERVLLLAPRIKRPLVLRNQFVRIEDTRGCRTTFLGRLLTGPFFPIPLRGQEDNGQNRESVMAEIEIQGEMARGGSRDTSNRAAPGSLVYARSADEVSDLLGCRGDMLLGTLSGRSDLNVLLQSNSKDVLPRNVGIFGTVGSGKSNTAQVLIEEATARGWAVIV